MKIDGNDLMRQAMMILRRIEFLKLFFDFAFIEL